MKCPGNVPSHSGAVEWIDKAIALVKPHTKRVCLRGDTDFSLTGNFDLWSEQVAFVFGMDARSGLKKQAVELPEGAWEELNRKPKYQVKTEERQKAVFFLYNDTEGQDGWESGRVGKRTV